MTDTTPVPPKIYIIAGPNGAGKSSFAKSFLPDFVDCREFLNADLIAAGLSPFSPESQAMEASRIMLSRMQNLVKKKQTFSFETTLAGRSYRQMIPEWSSAGYQIVLFFLWLPDVEIAVQRVATRVQGGGHNIPEHDIRRRFRRGLTNLFDLYIPVIDRTFILDSSYLPPRLVWSCAQNSKTVLDKAAWDSFNDCRETNND